jgi:hypothetical protein
MTSDEKPSARYLHPYACFQCRKSFRRASRPKAVLACPHCAGPSIRLDRKFKAPKSSDIKQWRKVESLVRHGFWFESVDEPYPIEIGDVEAFAQKHAAYLLDHRRKYPKTHAAIEAALNR